jgi:hypothetical protein
MANASSGLGQSISGSLCWSVTFSDKQLRPFPEAVMGTALRTPAVRGKGIGTPRRAGSATLGQLPGRR